MSAATCHTVVAGLAIAMLLPSTIVRASGSAPVPEPRRAAPALRPNFLPAIEYLGETQVDMGRRPAAEEY